MWYSSFYNGLLDHRYACLGIQYYLLARVGARYLFNPSSGNLYHLSFELLIKSYLRKKYSADAMQNKFGHNLVKLWDEFKSKIEDTQPNKFDLIVKNLDSWEKVRYISLKGDKNAQAIEIVPGSSPEEYLEMVRYSVGADKRFRIYTDDMDELFSYFFSTLKVPAEELLRVPDFTHGRQLYERDNKYNLLDQAQ